MLTRQLILAALLATAVQAAAADADRQFVNGDRSASRAALPFSDAVQVGDTLYISGHIGIDAKTDRAAEDPQVEARLVMERFKHTVEAAGMTMDEVVSVQVYCTDLSLYDTFNAAYRKYLGKDLPARAFLGAGSLLLNARFEMQAIAMR